MLSREHWASAEGCKTGFWASKELLPEGHAAPALVKQHAACAQFTLAVGLTGQVSLSKVLFLEQGTLCTPSLATVTPCMPHNTS